MVIKVNVIFESFVMIFTRFVLENYFWKNRQEDPRDDRTVSEEVSMMTDLKLTASSDRQQSNCDRRL